MSHERETHGTPGKLVDALLERVSDALESLQKEMLQRVAGLLPIPGASALRPEPLHDPDQRVETSSSRF